MAKFEELKVDFKIPKMLQNDIDGLRKAVENDELCIPKGGWKDRYGNYFTPNPEIGKLGPLNIFFINSVDPSSYNQNLQARLNKLLKENN